MNDFRPESSGPESCGADVGGGGCCCFGGGGGHGRALGCIGLEDVGSDSIAGMECATMNLARVVVSAAADAAPDGDTNAAAAAAAVGEDVDDADEAGCRIHNLARR